MARCLISFGANLGVPAVTIRQAVEQIRGLLGSRLRSLHLSRLVRTPAVGGPTGQPPFVNAVAALDVIDSTAWDIWHVVRAVEQSLGRVRQERWEARRIDLDVLMFEDQRIWTPQFKLPHPRMVMRRFILEPANDVAADWVEPVSGWSMARLAASLAEAPASILLVSQDVQRDQRLIDDAARAAQCELISVSLRSGDPECEQPSQRWLALIASTDLFSSSQLTLSPSPRMVVFLAPPSQTQGAAWEDLNRPLARRMGLCPSIANAEPTGSWPLNGPRYLLSTDDVAWSQHEIIAALDAMDCPVEPMKS